MIDYALYWHRSQQPDYIAMQNLNDRLRKPTNTCWCGTEIKTIKSDSYNAILSVDEYMQYMKEYMQYIKASMTRTGEWTL